jgi:hypothetical protein
MKTNKELQKIALEMTKGTIFSDWQIPVDEDVVLVFPTLDLLTDDQQLKLIEMDVGMIFAYMENKWGEGDDSHPIFMEFELLTKKESLYVADCYTRFKQHIDAELEPLDIPHE